MAYTNFNEVEKKWIKYWDENGTFHTDLKDFSKPKYYVLDMFPYPSGAGLHVGHPEGYTATDVIARMKRMQGYNVLHPIGFDSFGLPAEQYAIKTGNNPADFTQKNIETFTSQLKMLGLSYDYTQTVSTCDPSYYKWTQWIFKQLYEAGLARYADTPVNWCEERNTVLANEQVVEGCCERCGTTVVRKNLTQWFFKITAYAEELLSGLDKIDWPEKTKAMQRNWIGKSVGANVDFKVDGTDEKFTVFTTRCDTLFGATYCVLAPEHALVDKITAADRRGEIEAYKKACASKSELERTELNKEKTGAFTGAYAINPVNGAKLPIYISDYVLTSYGTGAIMAVPAHDTRDYEFAKKFDIPIIQVLEGGDISKEAYTGDGLHINSGFLDGLNKQDAIDKMAQWLVEHNCGKKTVSYKLREWIFARQRYWGEPIPMVYCEHCGWQPIDESELPLRLPMVDSYEPTDDGESPLAKMTDWVNTTCPKCGGPAKRETDTMPQWAGSSWYFLRYCDPHNDKALASKESLQYWTPIDWYNGGMEHTTLHLLYSRFWHKFLYDIGVVPTSEPYKKRTSHGMILGSNGEKMSKSRGNIVNPDEIVEQYGADTIRLYEMFIGDFEKAAPWNSDSIKGCKRFLDRVWGLSEIVTDGGYRPELEADMHKAVKKVTYDIDNLKDNTAIATMMTLVNKFYDTGAVTREELRTLLILLNPLAPHLTEELYEQLGFGGELNAQQWPSYDEAKCVDDMIQIAVQVNGKVRAKLEIQADLSQEEALRAARENDKVRELLSGKTIVKEIYVKGKLVNLVVK